MLWKCGFSLYVYVSTNTYIWGQQVNMYILGHSISYYVLVVKEKFGNCLFKYFRHTFVYWDD